MTQAHFDSSPRLTADADNPSRQCEQSTPPNAFIIGVSPASMLLMSSVPLLAGTYFGYRRVVRQGDVIVTSKDNAVLTNTLLTTTSKAYSSTSVSASRASSVPITTVPTQTLLRPTTALTIASKVKPVSIAMQALALGSMLSVGGVGLLTAGVFLFSGCRTVGELVDCWKAWTPQMRVKVESYLGIESLTNRYANDEDVKAAAGMTEAEEIEFYGRKYVPELFYEDTEEKKELMASSSILNKR